MNDTHVLCYAKGRARFVWLYTDATGADVLRSLERFAANPEIDFTWWDAEKCSQKVLKQTGALPL